MKPIQIVIDEQLLTELDRLARQRHQSRSAFIRSAIEHVLQRNRYLQLAEQERKAYARKPLTARESRAARDLQRASDRAWERSGERW